MEKLKQIVRYLNEIFNKDYNLSSFDAIRGNDLLDLLVALLKKLEIFELEEGQTCVPLQILNCLEMVKYAPKEDIAPSEFRTGLVAGLKDIVYPILTFLIENSSSLKKRFYLAKYVNKLEIPLEFLSNDIKLQNLYQIYQQVIDKFWIAYSENIREESFAKETAELEEDTYQMKTELINLEKRIDAQSRKVALTTVVLKTIEEFVKEKQKFDKLSKQLENDKLILLKETEMIRNLNRRDKISSLEELLEKNEYYADAQQVYAISVKDITIDLNMIEAVAIESSDDNLQELEREQATLMQFVNEQNINKQQDETLCIMQNQQRVLVKKKALLSKQVATLRLHNEQLLNKIDELSQILGGDILRGLSYKNYIGSLKEMSNVYKKCKSYIKALENEENILTKTLDELYEMNPDLKEKSITGYDDQLEEIRHLSVDEVRIKTLKLYNEYNVALKACHVEENKYQRVKDVFSENLMQFDSAKHAFNEEAGHINDCVERLEVEIKELEYLIDIENDDLQAQEKKSEELQDSLLRYSQMFIDNAGDVSTRDILRHRISVETEKRDALKVKVDLKQQELKAEEEKKVMTKSVITLIREGKHQF